jgi:hypothetical protein
MLKSEIDYRGWESQINLWGKQMEAFDRENFRKAVEAYTAALSNISSQANRSLLIGRWLEHG